MAKDQSMFGRLEMEDQMTIVIAMVMLTTYIPLQYREQAMICIQLTTPKDAASSWRVPMDLMILNTLS